MRRHILEMRGEESADLFKVLASETRVKILALLADGERNINELGQALGISQPTVTKHIQILEQIGLVGSEYLPGAQGMQKKCALNHDRLIISFETLQVPVERVEEVQMPIGLYTRVHAAPTCGLANRERAIGFFDDPQAFFHPDRATAQILWTAEGFVEYVFPCALPSSAEITRLDLSMEICSEAPHFENDYPSDITLWINDVEIGTWTCPGDFGGTRGRLNPPWWFDRHTQFGMLKVWSVDSAGTYVDGAAVSDVTLRQVGIVPYRSIMVRIGVKTDAEHRGGFNLFGRGFGNYEQDLVLRLHYAGRSDVNRGAQEAAGGRHSGEAAEAGAGAGTPRDSISR